MRLLKLLIFLVFLACMTALGSSPVDAAQRHRWWQSGEVKTTLDLTATQTAAIEDIYRSTRPVLRALMTAVEEERGELSDLIVGMAVEDWELTLQIDKAEAARSALSKERILMLYHIRQELTIEQQQTLTELEEERRRKWRERVPLNQ